MKTPMKLATITATFPELRGAYCYKTGRGKGSSAAIAMGRASADLFSKLNGRRVSVFKATITILEVSGNSHEERERQAVAA